MTGRVRLGPRLRAGAGIGVHPEGRELRGGRPARHDARDVLRLQRRPADGHADHLRRPERRARGEGLGELARSCCCVGANPLETRIPDAHFLSTRRRTAAASWWSTRSSRRPRPRPTLAPIEPGTDAALALALVERDPARGPGRRGVHARRTPTRHSWCARTRASACARSTYRRAAATDSVRRLGPEERRAGAVGTDRLGMPDGVRPALTGSYEVRSPTAGPSSPARLRLRPAAVSE